MKTENITKNDLIEIAKTRVEKLWRKHDRSAIVLGLALLELTDAVNDGEAGVTWERMCGATSFADYCRKLGMRNRVEYKYRNAAKNVKENRSDFVEDYKLVDDIDYIPGYTLLNLVEENKDKLKKVDGAWNDVIDLLYEKKETRYNIEVKISQYLSMGTVRPGSKKVNKTILKSSPIISKKQSYSEDNLDFELDNISISHDEKIEDTDEIMQDFYQRLSTNLPSYVDKNKFEEKFNELADLFGIYFGLAA